jgi:hypothetical protein
MIGLICVLFLLMKRRNPPKFLLLFLSLNQGMWRSFLSSLSLLKKGRIRRRRGLKGESKRYISLKHVAPIIVFDESELDDVDMPITYSSDHDWEKHTTFDIENLFGTNSENYEVNNCRCSGYRGIPVHLLLGSFNGPTLAQGRNDDQSSAEKTLMRRRLMRRTTAQRLSTRRPPHEPFLVRGRTASTSARHASMLSKKIRAEDRVPSTLPPTGRRPAFAVSA